MNEKAGEKMDKQEQIAQKIARLLESEKCTVNESHSILRTVEIIVHDSTFTVQEKKT
ncbi:hypothetical protein [Caproiciproducens sp. CPB-2]|uniref:hypothetical protein n=1 Tax=Caproiciproducens sp. CPB-2 TaxID=3030017 RepID=UPI0023DBED71|nr:hypothetical protein [Caproiciproducens sp. CPB-2]MDF1495186.1 hypothetical protein [Caproiciproducens sp. CPB-2]